MNVSVAYQFHDYKTAVFVLDTTKLKVDLPFENDLKIALESEKDYIRLD